MPGILDRLLEVGKEVAEQQLGELLNRLGQDVLDSSLDKLLVKVSTALKEAGLDPLPVPDITVPYSLDKLSGACLPVLREAKSPAARILAELLSCLATTMKVEGELLLSSGLLSGLSGLARHGPTQIEVAEGCASLSCSLALPRLCCPFTVTNSQSGAEVPQLTALVDVVRVSCSVLLPLDRGRSSSGEVVFLPSLEDIPVELDMDLGELGALEGVIRPLVVDPVRKRLVSALKEEVARILREELAKLGLASLID